MSLRRYACAMVCLVFFAPKAAAQTATISSMAPGAEATTSTLYMVCGAYAAASESWDRVAATLDLTWPGGSRSNYAEFGPGGGTFSVSADVPYAQADVTVGCNLSVMSLATGATSFDGAQYVIRPSAPADLRIDSYGPLIWDFPDQGGAITGTSPFSSTPWAADCMWCPTTYVNGTHLGRQEAWETRAESRA